MKKFAAVVVGIAIVAGLYFAFKSKHAAPKNPPVKNIPTVVSEKSPATLAAATTGKNSPIISPAVGATTLTNGPATQSTSPPSSTTMGISSLPPLTVLDNARVVVKNYSSEFGENPVGTNSEITEALLGKNSKGINFMAADSGLRVNDQGEMVDAYGTPFFFHQISGKEMEIRSAGADRKMWTFDDLVTR